jgi:hypothetical protein
MTISFCELLFIITSPLAELRNICRHGIRPGWTVQRSLRLLDLMLDVRYSWYPVQLEIAKFGDGLYL